MTWLCIMLCLTTQLSQKQKELDQLKEKLTGVRSEINQLEKQKIGTLAHIEKIDEGIALTITYIDELTAQETRERNTVQELSKNIAKLEGKMKHRKDDLRERLVRLYKWTPFYKLEVLFSSKSLPQILSSSYYLQILAKNDQKAFFEFKSDWERYITDKRLREELIERLEQRKKDKETELARLNDERRLKKNILDKVAREESEKIKLEKELKSAQRKLEELIVKLEKERVKVHTGPSYVENQRGTLTWPCRGTVVTQFGKIIHPKYNTKTKNNGIDISASYGDNVHAVAPGKVVYADRFMGYGNMVLVDHLDGFYSLYGHLAEILVDIGQQITEGRIIGRIGESGSLSGPMLHFELRKDGKPVDPLAYLR
ncbi:MAG: peptidoglycan DD-metalloendopeptidase family protein [candidate division WOR-3 bacterium]|nr:MAG: peptidoglycan DD-metalloendopeptidase family protein [candidate division WOR-3 bacterium]